MCAPPEARAAAVAAAPVVPTVATATKTNLPPVGGNPQIQIYRLRRRRENLGDPAATRTQDLEFRRLSLYPAELQGPLVVIGQWLVVSEAEVNNL